MTLHGRRILVTRASHQAGRLAGALAALDAEVIEIPAIEIRPPDSYEPLDDALRNIHLYRWLLVTSANAVPSLRQRLEHLGLSPSAFSPLRIAAIGNSTAAALREAGLSVALIPPEAVAESLLAVLPTDLSGQGILLVRARVARDLLPEQLAHRGARVHVVDAYQTVIPDASVTKLQALFADPTRLPDAITFTSASTVHNLLSLAEKAGVTLPKLPAVSIGPVTSSALREQNWGPVAEANPHDLDGLVQAVLEYFRSS